MPFSNVQPASSGTAASATQKAERGRDNFTNTVEGRYSRFFTRGHHVRVVLAAFSRRPGLVALDRASSLQGDAGAVVHRTEDPGFCFRFAEDGVTATRVVDLPRPTCW